MELIGDSNIGMLLNEMLEREHINSEGIWYLGSGYSHHYAMKVAEQNFQMNEKFTLFCFDMHNDAVKSKNLTCGTWLYHLLKEYKNMNAVIYGCADTKIYNLGRLEIIYYTELDNYELPSEEKIALSVDIDVVKAKMKLGRREWNAGMVELDRIKHALRHIVSNNDVKSIDICGHREGKKLDKRTANVIEEIVKAIKLDP